MAYSTINKSTDHFNTVLYSGTGSSSTKTVGFQPDWVWIKSRSLAYSHDLYDSVRGTGKRLQSNTYGPEDGSVPSGGVTAFTSNGFTVGGGYNGDNASGETYASWNWKAGTTSGITTNGSTTITPTAYSINATAGFSIIKYSGNSGGSGYSAKIPHGLGAAPKMIIIKNIDSSSGGGEHWTVYHSSLSAGHQLYLNLTNGQNDEANEYYDTVPDSVNFTVGTSDRTNNTNYDYVAYCFAEIPGYSKVGSYLGNAASDGPFIYTGFAPQMVIIKSFSNNHWMMRDNKRPGYNMNQYKLFPDRNVAENTDTSNKMDLLSNGFKCRETNTEQNGTGTNYMWIAFGQPMVGSNNVTVTAR